ncbi:hypothetical protein METBISCDRAFT_27186 [Metschnikowia bicuspidata]|uniref:Uncharacterized protein n=1 Tax=Metschnikowia bicuspidata TaxID=27322 RepID=A0A4P9ZE70_9ASCO|nr:hypothetical protein METBISCDRAFT_27186 [Metschnikowia bicuspidata]
MNQTPSSLDAEWLQETKSHLLLYKPNNVEFLSLQRLLEQLVAKLQLPSEIDALTVLLVDTLLVWFSRATQWIKKNELCQEIRSVEPILDRVFRFVDSLHHASLGAFTNALAGLLKKLLQFLDLTRCSDSLLCGWVELTLQRPPTQKSLYVILENMLKWTPKSAPLLQIDESRLFKKIFEAMRHGALANAASKCTSLYFKRLHSDLTEQTYNESWTPFLEKCLRDRATREKATAHLVPMLFRETPESLVVWIQRLKITRRDPEWPAVVLPLLQVGKSLCKANDPFKTNLLLELDIQDFLCQDKTRLNAFSFVCSSVTASSAPPSYFYDILLNCSIRRLLVGELLTPDDRTTFVTNLRGALLRMKGFVDKNTGKKTQEVHLTKAVCLLVFNFMHSLLIPDLSYAQLCTATELILFLITDEFDGILRSNKKPGTETFVIFTPELVRSLLRITTNNYDDIRRLSSSMLSFCPYKLLVSTLDEQSLQNSLQLLSLAKQGSVDICAFFFSTIAAAHARNDTDAYFRLLKDIMVQLETLLATGLPIGAALGAISAVIGVITQPLVESHHTELETLTSQLLLLVRDQWRELAKVEAGCDALYWKVVKESAQLIQTIVDVNAMSQMRLVSEPAFLEICNILMDQLASVLHRGAFSAIFLAFVRCCSQCFSGHLLQKPREWLEENLNLVKTKKQLVSRRSAGLPFLISGILIAANPHKNIIDEYMCMSFTSLLSLCREEFDATHQSTVDLPQVNAFNCMTQIFRESTLKPHYHAYLGAALDTSLCNLNHAVWAIKNSALMLFTALQSSFFGSNKLDDVLPSVKAELFFTQYPEIRVILRAHLELLKSSEANEVIPILSILGRLHGSAGSYEILKPFKTVISENYLGHLLWKIREIAAAVICNMSPATEIQTEMAALLQAPAHTGNLAHGRLLCVLALVRRVHVEQEDAELGFLSGMLKEHFEAQQQTQNFSKWVLLRFCVMIMHEKNLVCENLTEISRVLDDCMGQHVFNGTAKLFISTVVPIVLKDTKDSRDRVGFSKKLLHSNCEEAWLETVRFWLSDVAEFRETTELHARICELTTTEKISRHVFKVFLQLAAEVPLCVDLDDTDWPAEWVCYNMRIQAASGAKTAVLAQRFLEYCQDDQPENVRYNALLAAQTLLAKREVSEDMARVAFSVCEKQSDEAVEVRSLARSIASSHEELRDTSAFLSRFGDHGAAVVLESLLESITRNISDAKQELSATHFDVERNNLYRNEINDFERNAKGLLEHSSQTQKLDILPLCACVEDASRAVMSHEPLLRSWTYNVHFDTAIRKVAVLAQTSQNKNVLDACQPLLMFLHALKYPLQSYNL